MEGGPSRTQRQISTVSSITAASLIPATALRHDGCHKTTRSHIRENTRWNKSETLPGQKRRGRIHWPSPASGGRFGAKLNNRLQQIDGHWRICTLEQCSWKNDRRFLTGLGNDVSESEPVAISGPPGHAHPSPRPKYKSTLRCLTVSAPLSLLLQI